MPAPGGDDGAGIPAPGVAIPPDPPADTEFALACLLARAAPVSEVLAALGPRPDGATQRSLVDALTAARAWVGGGRSPGPPGYAARLLRRAVTVAEAGGGGGGGGDHAVDEGLAAALAAALLEEGGGGGGGGHGGGGGGAAATPFHAIALVFGRAAHPATLLRLRVSADLLAGGTGCAAWPAAAVLGAALAGGGGGGRGGAPRGHHPSGRPVLELGAGTGALGLLVARACGPASLVLTDGDAAALANAAENVRANGFVAVEVGGEGGAPAAPPPPPPPPPPPLPSVSLARLAWAGPPLPPGLVSASSRSSSSPLLVLGADITYDPATAPALAACLGALLGAGGPGAAALVAGVERTAGSVAAFEAALTARRAELRWERWDVSAAAAAGGVASWGGAAPGGAVVGWVVERR